MRSAKALAEARLELRNTVAEFFMEVFCQESINHHTLNVLSNYAEKHGIQVVMQWIEITVGVHGIRNDIQAGKYISGIRRQWIEDGRIDSGE